MKVWVKRLSMVLAIVLLMQSINVEDLIDFTVGYSYAELDEEYDVASGGSIVVENISGGAIVVDPTPEGDGIGLKGFYYINTDFTDLYKERTDETIDFDWGTGGPVDGIGNDSYSVIWKGYVTPRYTGQYTFRTETHGGARLHIGGETLIDELDAHSHITQTATIDLEQDISYELTYEYIQDSGSGLAKLFWSREALSEEIVPMSQLKPPFVPDAPENINTMTGSGSITLSWDSVNGATGYEVRRDGETIADLSNTSYTDENLNALTPYSYQIRAYVPGVVSDWSKSVEATTKVAVPAGLSAKVTSGEILISWNAVDGADSYEIDIEGLGTYETSANSYTQDAYTPAATYSYKVRAVNSGEAGDWSDTLDYTTPSDIPAGLEAEASYNSISMAWGEVADTDYYEIEVDGDIVHVGTNTYVHENLLTNTTHTYRVRSTLGGETSNWSEMITVSTLREVGTGIGLRADYYSDEYLVNHGVTRLDEQINFDWKKSSPASGIDNDAFSVKWTGQIQALYTETYTFYTRTHGGVKLWIEGEQVIDDWSAHNTTHKYAEVDLVAGKRYDIEMQYTQGNGVAQAILSWYSASQVEEPVPENLLYPIGIPSGMNSESEYTNISLSWNSVTNATGYEIEVDGDIIDMESETSYTHLDLVPGTEHEYRLRAYDGFSTGEWSEIYTAVTKLEAVETIETYDPHEEDISIKWSDVTGAACYDIELDGKIVDAGALPAYTHDNLLSGTNHTYRARAKTNYAVGPWSAYITCWTRPGIPSYVNADATETEIYITWDEAVRGATGYDIEYDGTVREDVSIMFIYENLSQGTEHGFRVRAKNSSGTGKWTQELKNWTLPDIPENISITSYETSQALTWNPVIGAKGYDVEFYDTPMEAETNTFTAENLVANTQYAYKVRAKNTSGNGKWSQVVAKMTLPQAPNKITVTQAVDSLQFKWEPVAGVEQYEVEIDGENTFVQTELEYMLENLEPDTIHKIRVRSTNDTGTSTWSDYTYGTTQLERPTGLVLNQTESAVELSWTQTENYTYELEADGEVHELSTNTYLHEGLEANSEHVYRLRALTENNASAWTDTLSTTTLLGMMSAPAVEAESTQVTVKWTSVYGAISYELEIDGTAVNMEKNTEYIHENLEANSTHTYRVRALNKGGDSSWSERVSVDTKFLTPENLAGSATSDTITLSWDTGIGAQSYDLMIDGTVVEGITGLEYIHNKLESNTWHVYRVRSRVDELTSDWSESLAVVTMPAVPTGIDFLETETTIKMTWDSVSGAAGYELEIDGEHIKDITSRTYKLEDLEPDTHHTFKVRTVGAFGNSDWSSAKTVWTTPMAPVITSVESTTNSITVKWDDQEGTTGYEVQIDGEDPEEVDTLEYSFTGLEANSWHNVRVRSVTHRSKSRWSDTVEKNTEPEIMVQVEKDRVFNFVVVAPADSEKSERTIQVHYDPEALEVVDLSAITPELELTEGPVNDTDITVAKHQNGYIEYLIKNATKTIVNSIKFMKKTSEDSGITYEVK